MITDLAASSLENCVYLPVFRLSSITRLLLYVTTHARLSGLTDSAEMLAV